MQHFLSQSFGSAQSLASLGAWFGNPDKQAFAAERVAKARNGQLVGDQGWNNLVEGRGCFLELITKTAGTDSITVAGKLFNFPQAFCEVLYQVFDNHTSHGGRSRYCRDVVALIMPGTDLDEVAHYVGERPTFAKLKEALALFAPLPASTPEKSFGDLLLHMQQQGSVPA